MLSLSVGGLATGALYSILAIGILIVFRVSKQLNFAYGQAGMVAAFSSWAMYTKLDWNPFLAILVGLFLAALILWITNVFIVERLPPGQPGYELIATLGVFLLLTAAAQTVLGTQSHSYLKLLSTKNVTLGSASLNANDILVIFVGGLCVVAFYFLMVKTRLGVSLRAAAERPDVALSTGINVGVLRMLVWALSGVIAGLVAILFASRTSVGAFYVTPILIKAFVVAIVGGLERFWIPIGAGLLLGLYEAWIVYLFGTDAQVPAVFALALFAMAAVPKRFVQDEEARA